MRYRLGKSESQVVNRQTHEKDALHFSGCCDDSFTIYPDGVAARELTHWCSSLDEWHSYEQDNFDDKPVSGAILIL
jgi:hypothetical protein